ncbi:hypothetical protein CC86DRAFT_410682 [Ophiobolus disseminans]|uniref:Uncharacterized protein n=1 Tax=Ophiobolus disseminans TaxID=1469910 RepID=A0A6A6ZMU9_9PLEO|nr:hypothetical protein CC86DRAFT_410682 [Ophiobolus disseminans]
MYRETAHGEYMNSKRDGFKKLFKNPKQFVNQAIGSGYEEVAQKQATEDAHRERQERGHGHDHEHGHGYHHRRRRRARESSVTESTYSELEDTSEYVYPTPSSSNHTSRTSQRLEPPPAFRQPPVPELYTERRPIPTRRPSTMVPPGVSTRSAVTPRTINPSGLLAELPEETATVRRSQQQVRPLQSSAHPQSQPHTHVASVTSSPPVRPDQASARPRTPAKSALKTTSKYDATEESNQLHSKRSVTFGKALAEVRTFNKNDEPNSIPHAPSYEGRR